MNRNGRSAWHEGGHECTLLGRAGSLSSRNPVEVAGEARATSCHRETCD